MKVKEFLSEKLKNFVQFIDKELKKVNISKEQKDKIRSDLNAYIKKLDIFTTCMYQLSNYGSIDKAIEVFLQNYEIDISKIKDDIDYDKLYRYIAMFIKIIEKEKSD